MLARGATLEFVRDGTVVARLDDATLAKDCGLRTIEHPTARDVDALVAYFRTMAACRHDPGGRR